MTEEKEIRVNELKSMITRKHVYCEVGGDVAHEREASSGVRTQLYVSCLYILAGSVEAIVTCLLGKNKQIEVVLKPSAVAVWTSKVMVGSEHCLRACKSM